MESLRPFFSYYGGKWLKAKHYSVPRYETVIEPFAGSAGYSVRHFQHDIILCDADPVIYGVWDYLIHVKPSEIRRLPSIVDKIDSLAAWVPQEAKWLIGFWLNPGSAVPKKTMSKWQVFEHSNGGQLYWGDRVKDRLAAQVGSISHWSVFCCSWQDVEPQIPATWFIDPPYQQGGQHYRKSISDLSEFKSLGSWCRDLPGQVIVCERGGADWLPFRKLYEGRSAKYQFSEEAVFEVSN